MTQTDASTQAGAAAPTPPNPTPPRHRLKTWPTGDATINLIRYSRSSGMVYLSQTMAGDGNVIAIPPQLLSAIAAELRDIADADDAARRAS